MSHAHAHEWTSLAGLRGTARCTCSEAQLSNVGCDCPAEQNLPVTCDDCSGYLRTQNEIDFGLCTSCADNRYDEVH